MAKFHNYHVLCPLIDKKTFLGVATARKNENLIVTLGRNVVNKYQVRDQKHTGGWTSRDHITTAIIYDYDQKCYVGVFNNNTIKTWTDNTENLDKTKKYKCSKNILTLIPNKKKSNQPSIVVFSDGNCAFLPHAIENKQSHDEKRLLKDSEIIVDCNYFTMNEKNYLCYIVKNDENKYKVIYAPLKEEFGVLDKCMMVKIDIERPESVYVVGKLISVNEESHVFILWSDSKMSMLDLNTNSWRILGGVPWISTVTSVSMASMAKNHLILFGSNIDQDGAILVSYNFALGIGACKYPMKMYSDGARLYCFFNRIVLEASNHIGMLPYAMEENRNLSSLLGSYEIFQGTQLEIADWSCTRRPVLNVHKEVQGFVRRGYSERTICSQVIPPLLERDDYMHVLTILGEFKDVPESVLVLLLNYIIRLINVDDVDFTKRENFIQFCSEDENSLKTSKFQFLNHLFQMPFSDALIIPYLKSGLSLNNALFLNTYISYLLVDSDTPLDSDTESKLFDWCTLLMDSFYQQYIMSKDEKVAYVLNDMKNIINDLINQLLRVDRVMPLLRKIVSGRTIENDKDSKCYTIEMLDIL